MIGRPDEWQESGGSMIRLGGSQWLATASGVCKTMSPGPLQHYVLNISNIQFITLSSAVGLVAMLDELLNKGPVDIDLRGVSAYRVLNPGEYIQAHKSESAADRTPEYYQAHRMYKLAGFLESLGTRAVLNRPGRGSELSYTWLGDKGARLGAFATRPDGTQTVIMPLMRIETKAHCKRFLDPAEIVTWREAMGDRFRNSPLFESEEVWRIFCHELAVNIFEHANSAGFLAARVVEHDDLKLPWCLMSYPPETRKLFPAMTSGFLELCISDAGQGFLATLGPAYRERAGLEPDAPLSPVDVLQFAFDEVGTCKQKGECWATERHALGRILQIVAKYGGALTVRSSGAEVSYISNGGPFDRLPNHLGYTAQTKRLLPALAGSHLQIILPLIPFTHEKKEDWRKSILLSTLPSGFHPDPKHVRGHLVPLMEVLDCKDPWNASVGPDELLAFRDRCETLAKRLLEERPALEPIILDFSNLNWAAPQFETLLHLLQNVLQTRPILLVEIAPSLMREVIEMEREAPTQLNPVLADTTPSITGRAFAELSEASFLETYQRVHSTVLGLDINGKPHIFGVKHDWCEKLLLSLIKAPRTLENLCSSLGLEQQRLVRAIFNNMNPLFYVETDGKWHTVWDQHALEVEARRVMTRHFDGIAKACKAWRGLEGSGPEKGTLGVEAQGNTRGVTFNLPWQDEWVSSFFESARVLSRQRYADEAAQRLIFRIQKGLELNEHSISDVQVLACVTAPAILLATALHRWWPTESRPAIADLGPYLMMNPDGPLPAIASAKGIVIVQDVLDRRRISNRLVEKLKAQGKEVLCILSLARLVDEPEPVGVTPIDEGWRAGIEDPPGLKSHALVHLRRPPRCDPSDHNDEGAYWVEPRTLRPFRYSTLRRELRSKDTARTRVRPFFTPTQEGLICSGHYVYGERHYTVAVDIKKALDGSIGAEVSAWLADVCQGCVPRSAAWECARGKGLTGDVTAVLMPLHSQIHYLWPQIDRLLGQRGRRQLMWLLDATLFLGHGPAYRLPLQFVEEIERTTQAMVDAMKGGGQPKTKGLRILIIDDAMASARTAETILAELERAVAKAQERAGPLGQKVSPVEWVRYFAVFNQMPQAKHQHWQSLSRVGGEQNMLFVFDAYRSILGVPVYEGLNCPNCTDLKRIQELLAAADRHSADAVKAWALQQEQALQPIAIDGPGFHKHPSRRLPRAIDLLARDPLPKAEDKYQVWTSDEAILRFHELMYMSYPPSDLLPALFPPNAWAAPEDGNEIKVEYERFRWAVLEWCLRNWPRLVADSARKLFKNCASAEVAAGSGLVERLFEGVTRHRGDDVMKEFIVSMVDKLADLESVESARDVAICQNNKQMLLQLETALTIFLLGIRDEELADYSVSVKGKAIKIVDYLATLAGRLRRRGLSFLGNLHLCFSRPRRADPVWALQVLAENLFRGRDPDSSLMSSHRLLPRLLSDIDVGPTSSEARGLSLRLLLSSLNLFVAALDDLALFAAGQALPFREVKQLAKTVLHWLKSNPGDAATPAAVTQLLDALSPEAELNPKANFYRPFSEIFHVAVGDLEKLIEPRYQEVQKANPAFQFTVSAKAISRVRVLTVVHRLSNFLCNWAIDPAEKGPITNSPPRSRIEVHLQPMPIGTDNLRFRILTNFADLATTENRTIHGRNYDVEVRAMTMFGGKLPDHWQIPSPTELQEGFTSAYEFLLPTGFIPRRNET